MDIQKINSHTEDTDDKYFKAKENMIKEAKKILIKYDYKIQKAIKTNPSIIELDFNKLKEFPKLYGLFLKSPEEALMVTETASDEIFGTNSRVRLTNPPKESYVKIEDLRAKHLNTLVTLTGFVVQASEVRPQVVVAKFECPDCKNEIDVLQIEKKFREPFKCQCDRKEDFILKSKEMVDAQRIVISTKREMDKDGKSKGHSISIYLQEDLTDPKIKMFNRLGKKIEIIGVLKEIPVLNDFGDLSVRFDIAIEANNLKFKD